MLYKNRRSILEVIKISIIKSYCDEGAGGVSGNIATNNVLYPSNRIMGPDKIHLSIKLFNTNRYCIMEVVVHAVIYKHNHPLLISQSQE